MGEPIKVLWEDLDGWRWSVDTDDAVYSGVCATEHGARVEMDGLAASLGAGDAAQRLRDLQARAAQAEADARLMLAAYYGADSASIARFGLGDGLLSEGDLQRLDSLRGATFYASEGETAAAMLRILATSGA